MARYQGWLLLALFWVSQIRAIPNCLAYVPTVNSDGTPIRWRSPIKLNLVGNPKNKSELTPSEFKDGVVLGLQRWKEASDGNINFDYWQGSNPQTFPPNNNYNGQSSVYFASNSTAGGRNGYKMSPSVLGMTQVWYNTDTGEILETDIELNDLDFKFTNNPTDTSGFGIPNSNSGSGKINVYIQNVITHELGHALGLSHSGGLQSTMLFMESPEQAHLACDELIAIHALYPTIDKNQRGSLKGQIVSESGRPIFGAHVLAISQSRGTVLATALTDKSGHYQISALETGSYFIMTEPFYAGPQALPAYYSSMSHQICPDSTPFSRRFLTEPNPLHLTSVPVASSQTTIAPTLSVQCDSSGGASILSSTVASSIASAPVITPPANAETNQFGVVDRLTSNHFNYYRLNDISGQIEIHALAYSLYSPIHTSLTLLTSEGNPVVNTQELNPIYKGDSGYINLDSAIQTDSLPSGDYILRVSADELQANDYPGGPMSIDKIPFLVITASLNHSSPPLASIPINARCRSTEAFPPYSDPSGIPPLGPSYFGNSSKGGGCGTLKKSTQDQTRSHSLDPYSIIGWFLPWLFMGVLCRTAIHLRHPI